MNKIIEKANIIIEQAINDENFVFNHDHKLVATGERASDYCAFRFDIDEKYYLVIDFVDYGFEKFSIVNKQHEDLISEI